jgi:5-methylcytosine-specific restriction endonuclease McrA
MVGRCANGCAANGASARQPRSKLYESRAWRKLSRSAIAEHVARYGNWCPGFAVPPHVSYDLTLDHVVPGTVDGGVAVLCRGCNSRKASVTSPRRGVPIRRRIIAPG